MNWYKIAKVNILEIYTAKLSRLIFHYLKEGRLKPGYALIINHKEHGIPFVRNVQVNLSEKPSEVPAASANAYLNNDLVIRINMPKDKNDWSKWYSYFNDIFKGLIRHELEHFKQDWDEDLIKPNTFPWLGNINELKDYYLSPYEIDAYVSGIYYQSKKSKRPFIEILTNMFNDIKQKAIADGKISDQEMDKLLYEMWPVYIDYARKRFPKAVFEYKKIT